MAALAPDLSALTLPELQALAASLRVAIRAAGRAKGIIRLRPAGPHPGLPGDHPHPDQPRTVKETTMNVFNKSDLIKDVASATGIPATQAGRVIDATLHMILGAAAAGDGYRLQGFGTFAPKTRAARTGRNPQTGAPVEIPARTTLVFKPAKPGKAGA